MTEAVILINKLYIYTMTFHLSILGVVKGSYMTRDLNKTEPMTRQITSNRESTV